MNELVKQLALDRQALAEWKLQVESLAAELSATQIGKDLADARARLSEAQENVNLSEQAVRNAALLLHAETGETRPHPAVSVKQYTVLTYDPDWAKDYSLNYLPNALRLDTTAFERAAKVLGLDFVTIGQEPRATIARDLSDYLIEELICKSFPGGPDE